MRDASLFWPSDFPAPAPFFCEENVWQLCRHHPGAAIFISNADRRIVVDAQRAAAGGTVVWDYHVVFASIAEGNVDVVDVDCTLGVMSLDAYLALVSDEPAPEFLWIDGGDFSARFSSNRAHMRDAEGRPTQTFPRWPAPQPPADGALTLSAILNAAGWLKKPAIATAARRAARMRTTF
jgi:hypothetical protein